MTKQLYLSSLLGAFLMASSTWVYSQVPNISETVSNADEDAAGIDTYSSPKEVTDQEGNINIITTYFGDYSLAIVKYSPDGELLNQIFPSNLASESTPFQEGGGNYMAMDNEDNYFILGYSANSEATWTIQKINPEGTLLWSYTYPVSPFNDINTVRTRTLAIDHEGNVITAGYVQKISGPYFGFMIKLSPEGNIIWSNVYDNPNYDYPNYEKLIVDASDNIFMCGYAASGNNYFWLAEKYDANGNLVWSNINNVSGSNVYNSAHDLVAAASGSLYVTGETGTWAKMTTMKYNTSGTVIWKKTYTGPGTGNLHQISYALFLDNSENVSIAGTSLSTSTGLDLTGVKYNKNGLFQWAAAYPYNTQINYPNEIFADAAMDANGNLIITGIAYDTTSDPFQPLTKELYVKIDPQGNILSSALYHPGEVWNEEPKQIVIDNSGFSYSVGSGYLPFNQLPSLYLIKRNSNDDVLYQEHYQVPSGGQEYHKSPVTDTEGKLYVGNNINDLNANANKQTRNLYQFDTIGNLTQVNTYESGLLNRVVRDKLNRILICGAVFKYFPEFKVCDPTGVPLWSEQLNTAGVATDITSDAFGNVYVTGYYTLFNGTDIFLCKYDSVGNQIWNITYKGAGMGNDEAYALDIDGLNNIFVTGRTQEGNTYNLLLLKFGIDGTLIWSMIPASINGAADLGHDVLADNTGGCYVTGRMTESPLNKRGFVTIKVGSTGNILKKIYRTGPEQSATDFGTHLLNDGQGNVYAEGRVMKNATPYGISVLKISKTGQLKWKYEKAGYNYAFDDSIGHDISYNDPLQVAVDGSNNVYVANVLNNTWDVKITKLNMSGIAQWSYTSPVTQQKILPAPDLICDSENNLWCVFNKFTEGLTRYDWEILKFDGSQTPLKIEQPSFQSSARRPGENLFTVYPNPATTNVTLSITNISTGTIQIRIHNQFGKTVYYSVEANASNNWEKTISLEELSAGIYSIEVIANDRCFAKQILKLQ